MPYYVVASDGPISVKQVQRPDLPDIGRPEIPTFPGAPEYPDTGGPPLRPGHGLPPHLPPKDEWPELPPWLQPGVGLPIPPSIEHPWVPLPDGPEVDPPDIWPPMPGIPNLPDLSGKTLILATFHVSRHVHYTRWVVIDHEEAKGKLERALAWVKERLPAGGVGGHPPNTRPPG
jgi:hypothetical protein